MSPVGDTLRIRCRKFPSLVNCCTLDWFDNWPRIALFSVAEKFLGDYKRMESWQRNALSDMFPQIH